MDTRTQEPQLKNLKPVPWTDLSSDAREIKGELVGAFQNFLEGGHYVLGPHLEKFEREFAVFCRRKYAIGVSSGTAALHLTLLGLGIKEGDEVITAPNAFIACASSIVLAGAKPVFVDVGDDMNMNPDLIESAITPRTRAILPVHLAGRLANMPRIQAIAKKHRLFLIEDAAQAVGARLGGKQAGSWGDATCTSFHPLKNLHAFGDGGMVTTDNQGLYERLKSARNHGLVSRDRCEFWSHNARLNDIHAAMLSVQLPHLNRWISRRRELALGYNEALRSLVSTPEERGDEYHSYQVYVIQADYRDELQTYLKRNNVLTFVHYPTLIPFQPAARSLGCSAQDIPVAAKQAKRILSLPLYATMTDDQRDCVAGLIKRFYDEKVNS